MAKCKLTRLPPKQAHRGRDQEPPPHLDFLSYLDANVKAKEWARKGIDLANAGKMKQARECEKKGAVLASQGTEDGAKAHPSVAREAVTGTNPNREPVLRASHIPKLLLATSQPLNSSSVIELRFIGYRYGLSRRERPSARAASPSRAEALSI